MFAYAYGLLGHPVSLVHQTIKNPLVDRYVERMRSGGGTRRGGADFQDMLERMPPLKLDELKPGDAIMLSATNGADPASVTAINVLAGVEPLLTA